MLQVTHPAPHPVLDELRTSLDHVLTALGQKWTDVPLTLKPVQSPARARAEQSFQVEGPDELTLRVRFGVYPLGDGTSEVYVEIEGGPTCRFTCDPTGDDAGKEKAQLGRKVTSVLYREIEPRLGQASRSSESASVATASVPRLTLDREGTIQTLNGAARDALVYADADAVDPNFFTHVHGHNLRRVMRDLARMVSGDLNRARWLLRLHTGTDRWRWYRAKVRNRLPLEKTIRVRLCPLEAGTDPCKSI